MTEQLVELPVPARLAGRPRDSRGHLVPFFVAYIDGVPDFRVIDSERMRDCVRFGWCWLCGKPLGRTASFVIGPMCTVNRVSAEPPMHLDCAQYAVRACPFLTVPHMRRRDSRLPENHVEPPGTMLRRNPGSSAIWSSRRWTRFAAGDGELFDIGDPVAVSWWSQGRPATRDEVLESIESGLPLLREPAETEGPPAVAALERMLATALQLVP